MRIAQAMIMEMQHEAQNTRKVLERLPEDQLDFKPHAKSMSLGQLAAHVAEIYQWADMTVNTDHLEFDSSQFVPFIPKTRQEVLDKLDASLKQGVDALETADDQKMLGMWKMSMNGNVLFEMPRVAVMRGMILNHTVHHRGQLTVYLRLLNVPLPAIYGPSADEQA